MTPSSRWKSPIASGQDSHSAFLQCRVVGREGLRVDPSPVLRLFNIISLEDLEEDEDYEALLEDLREGCEKFGTVVNLHVPRVQVGVWALSDAQQDGSEVPGLGYAFVQYSSVLEAAKAAKLLRLKTFNGKQVQLDYYPLSLFSRGVLFFVGRDLQDYGDVGELI